MSARDDLYRYGMSGKMHSPDNSERMSARIDAFKAEVLREAAARQRKASLFGPEEPWCDCGDIYCEACNTRKLIDLIDPDKEN